jgi:hypothetical protein
LTTPTRSDRYQLPSWPKTTFDRDLWNTVFGDIAERLDAREGLEASFELLQQEGIQASLDYIQANVAPQIANLQVSIDLAQDQIDKIIIDGISPNSAKLGGQLPAYYATAAALASGLAARVPNSRKVAGKELSEDVTLEKADVGLGNVDNTKDSDKPVSTPQASALAKRVQVDASQNFSASEKGQAIANIGAQAVGADRSIVINGDFSVNQRGGVVYVGSGYCFDRWYLSGATAACSRDLAGGRYRAQINGNTASLININFYQKFETIEFRKLLPEYNPDGRVTVSFDCQKTGTPGDLIVRFMTVDGESGFVNITTRMTQTITAASNPTLADRKHITFDLPAGITQLGSYLEFFAQGCSNTGGWLIRDVEVVPGLGNAQYFARKYQEELNLCQRFCRKIYAATRGYGQQGFNFSIGGPISPPMRGTPSLTYLSGNGYDTVFSVSERHFEIGIQALSTTGAVYLLYEALAQAEI